MNRRHLVGALGAAAFAADRDRFPGVYKLLSCERKAKDGSVSYPYGEHPVGRITYDKAGRMSAQLMRPGRKQTTATTPGSSTTFRSASVEDLREAISGFIAYFGTFDVDPSARVVTHHVQGCLVPSWVGVDLKRSYEFSGEKRLVLSAGSADASTRLVWEREPD